MEEDYSDSSEHASSIQEKQKDLVGNLFGDEDSFDEGEENGPQGNSPNTHNNHSQNWSQRETQVEDPENDREEDKGDDSPKVDFETLPKYTPLSKSFEEEEDQPLEEQDTVLQEMPYDRPDPNFPLYFTKLAGVSIEPRPFDPDTFNQEMEEEDKKPKKKLAPTAIRWRYGLDSNQEVVRESNARFVRWSDGSMHLFVGKDIFNVQMQDFKDHHDLFIRQRKDMQSPSFLQCHGILEKKIILNPTNNTALKRAALNKMNSVKKEGNRDRPHFISNTNDPVREKKRKEMIELDRAELRKKYGKEGTQHNLSTDFIEQGAGNFDYDEEREKASEARIMAAKRGQRDYSEEEEEEEYHASEEEPERKKRR